jgi:hypothetical protein
MYLNKIDQAIHADRFRSSHVLHFTTATGELVVLLTGVAILEFNGLDVDWTRDKVCLTLLFPPNLIPPTKAFRIDQWAPFVTINAVATGSAGAGWAVDEFRLAMPPPSPAHVFDNRKITIEATIAAHDTNDVLIRAGYSLMVKGVLVDLTAVPVTAPEGPTKA